MKDKIVAVEVQNVTKSFLLPHEKKDSIKRSIVQIFRTGSRKSTSVQRALKGVSFSVEDGQFFGIVGRNGSGKSTLLKMLAGIYKPTTGSIRTVGKIVPFIELGVGFNPELSGRENVYLNGALLGFSRKEIESRYEKIVEFAELERFMDQKLKNYSSGMQVRLAFAVAVTADADVLIVDEVLAVGDAAFQKKCYNYFMSLKQQKKTVILVTHDMEAVRQYCDQAVLIEKGKVAINDSAERVAQEYLKLFSKPSKQDGTSPYDADMRWGSHKSKFSRPSIEVHEDTIRVSVTLTSKERLLSPLIGFSIENAAGQRILGTNNELSGSVLDELDRNERLDLSWEFPNVLPSGSYKLNVAAELKGDPVALDWWNGALEFNVSKLHPTPFIVYPNYRLDIRRHET